MKQVWPWLISVVGCCVMAVSVPSAAQKVKVTASDKVDFSTLKTWGWSSSGTGYVRMARTADDDPEVVRQRAEPTLKEAVAAMMVKRGLTEAAVSPDIEVTYYLLITVGTQTQEIGQFLSAMPEWGLPPISGPTQSYKIIEQGSLVLDLAVNHTVVWRGVVQARLKPDQDFAKRQALVRKAVADVLSQYPPKQKK